MVDKSSSGPIPEGWRFEIIKKKDGSKVSSYCCPRTGQRFFTYEDMMRYVSYAKKAGLPCHMPNFHWSGRNQNAGQSSESADNQTAENLDSEKGIDKEKSLDLKKGIDKEKILDLKKGIDKEKILDLKKGTDIVKSLDSEKGTDTGGLDSENKDSGENLKSQNDPNENHSAPAADFMIIDDPFNVPHVASAAGTQSLVDPFIVEQTPNVPPVVGNPPGEEDSPLVAIPPAVIQEFAAGNPISRSGRGASKPRRFRRWGR